jgi:putative ABC transport system permease protein
MGNLAQDLRFALRSLWRRPGFAVVAVATLALGIGANTAIFSVVNGVLLSSLPYPDPSGLITIDEAPSGPGAPLGSMSGPDIFDIESEAPSISTLVGVNVPNMTLTGLGDPQVIEVTRLTQGLMATFHVTPFLGRDIRADEFGVDGPLRVALGARRDSIVRLVVGLGVALLGGRVMEAVLFGVQPRDPVILGGTALLSAVLPAYRAAKVDPIKALQAE